VKLLSFSLLFCLSYQIAFSKSPEWINSVYSKCSERTELCAVGEGTGKFRAEANARDELAKIFETKVKSITTIGTTSEQSSKEGVILSGEVVEDLEKSITLSTNQVLEGVEIIQTFEDAEGFYALAKLDKVKASSRLRNEMKALDEKMQAFLKEGRRSALAKSEKLYVLREKLNDRYEFLKGKRFNRLITYKEIKDKRNLARGKAIVVYFGQSKLSNQKELKHLIITELLANDYIVVTKKGKGHKYLVDGNFNVEKQHINVKGFEKFRFSLVLDSHGLKGKKRGGLEFSITSTGRTRTQALENSLHELRKYITDNINDLNLD
jgi:hypothetical protein